MVYLMFTFFLWWGRGEGGGGGEGALQVPSEYEWRVKDAGRVTWWKLFLKFFIFSLQYFPDSVNFMIKTIIFLH